MEKSKRFFVFDIKILISILFLMCMGGIAIYSSTYDANAEKLNWIFVKYIFFCVTGLILMAITMFLNYTKIAKHKWMLYVPMIVSLVLVLLPFFGRTINGSNRWLFGIVQPSEFGKIALIIVFAEFLNEIGAKIKTFKYLCYSFILCGIPMALILKQPDLGTTLVYIAIVITMLFVAGANLKYLVAISFIGIIGLAIPMFLEYSRMYETMDSPFFIFFSNSAYIAYFAGFFFFISLLLFIINFYMNNNRIAFVTFVFFVLFLGMVLSIALDKGLYDYQKQRLLVFLNPDLKRLSSGYNIIQSIIAVGSGGFLGKGFLRGSQSQLDFIPQQVNDFIFSNIGEEWGFLGSVLVFLAYAVILVSASVIAYRSKDRLGSIMVAGIVTMMLFHVVVNIGMVLGMLPVTGLTLPFISSGGSSIWTFSISIGLIFNVEMKRYVHGT